MGCSYILLTIHSYVLYSYCMFDKEIIQLLLNSSGALAVTIVFVLYLRDQQKSMSKRHDGYFEIIKEYHEKLQTLTIAINKLNEKIDEQKGAIHQMYEEMIRKQNIIHRYEGKRQIKIK